MYELNEVNGMVEAIFMVMDEHGIRCDDGHWLTEEELLRLPEAEVVLLCCPCKQSMKILIRVIESCRTGFGDVSKVFQNFDLQHINIQGILRLSKKLVDVLFVVAQSSLTDFLSFFRARNSFATSRSVRSSQTIFIRILCTSQFVKTVGLEDVFGFAEFRIMNFFDKQKREFTALRCEFPILAGAQGLEP